MNLRKNQLTVMLESVLVRGTQTDAFNEEIGVEIHTSSQRMIFQTDQLLPMELEHGLRMVAGRAFVSYGYGPDTDEANRELVAFVPDGAVCPLDCVQEDACPVPGVVARFRALHSAIGNAALRRFVSRVFSLPDVFLYYWTGRGSLKRHHDRAGGLATHSVSMAEAAQRAVHVDRVQRDLGIVAALFHDVGKIWAYEHESHTVESRLLGHEVMGFVRLVPFLRQLTSEWPQGGHSVTAMLYGAQNKYGQPKVPPVLAIVRSIDFYDGDRDLARRGDARCHGTWPEDPDEPAEALGDPMDELY